MVINKPGSLYIFSYHLAWKVKVKVTQLCPTLCYTMDYTVHGILQARILEWVALPFSRGSSQPGIKLRSPTLQADSLPAEPQRKPMTNLDSILKNRNITLKTKVCLVKALVFLEVMYRCESWTIRKGEHQRIDVFELRCWRRLLGVPWTARRSISQS